MIIAPEGFLQAAISENVGGTVMIRRAMYMYGVLLPKDAQGHVDTGLGKGCPGCRVSRSSRPRTRSRHGRGVDRRRRATHLPDHAGTEAPAEMNIYIPEERALCMARIAPRISTTSIRFAARKCVTP